MRTDPLSLVFAEPLLVSILAIDPSLTRTGIALLTAPAYWSFGRLLIRSSHRTVDRIWSYSYKERAGGFARAMAAVEEALRLDRYWIPVLEWPPTKKVGGKNTSHEAAAMWRTFLLSLASKRWAAAQLKGQQPNPERALLDPYPQDWRGPIGVATKGVGRTEAERAEWIKAQARAYAARELEAHWRGPEMLVEESGRVIAEPFRAVPFTEPHPAPEGIELTTLVLDSDAAEAVCIGTWACRNVGTIGTWIQPNAKPKLLRALV